MKLYTRNRAAFLFIAFGSYAALLFAARSKSRIQVGLGPISIKFIWISMYFTWFSHGFDRISTPTTETTPFARRLDEYLKAGEKMSLEKPAKEPE